MNYGLLIGILIIIILIIINLSATLRLKYPILDFSTIFKFKNFEPKPVYIFWTGGYDSTFRICELLIIQKVPVKPIYIKYNLDSENKTDFWVRKNRKEEMDAMKKIRNILNQRFPYTKNLFKKTKYINKNSLNYDYDKKFLELNLWPNKRKIHQYNHLGSVSYKLKKHIETGVLGLKKNSPFSIFINKHISNNYQLSVPENHPLFYLSFPLMNKTKKDLCMISKKYNFNDIIKMSWSCWFPVDGKPCHQCPMCIERFQCN